MRVLSISDQLFFTTVKIDTLSYDGKLGSGTGFFFMHQIGNIGYPFVVTNKHVVMGKKEGKLSFIGKSGDDPDFSKNGDLKIENWPDAWFGHPDPNIDIAIVYAKDLLDQFRAITKQDFFIKWITSDMMPSDEELKQIDSITPVVFVGYPNGIWDTVHLLPVARRGYTASPLTVDFENTPRFVIDASVFGGSSGSPVFAINEGRSMDGSITIGGKQIYFLGVVAAVFYRTAVNEVISVPIPTEKRDVVANQEMLDLGIVFKGRTVVETIQALLTKNNGMKF